MKNRMSNKANLFGKKISPVREIMMYANKSYIENLGIKPDDLISFAGGWVSHHPPEELKKSYAYIIENEFYEHSAYSATTGNERFKEAIVQFNKTVYGNDYGDLKTEQICVGHSSTQLVCDLLDVLLDEGDTITLLDPTYCNYPVQIEMRFPRVNISRFNVLDTEAWKYNENSDSFYDYILKVKPKVILLISPDNPTSKVLSDDFIKNALSAAQKVGSFIVVDFAYKEIVFDSFPEYFSWLPNDHFISLRSNSKWCRGLGRRLGWVEAPSYIVDAMETMQNTSILCPDMLHQSAFTHYVFNNSSNCIKKYIKRTSTLYENAAKKTIEAIESYTQMPALKPEGGLYTCLNVGMPGPKFVEKMLKESGVLFVPGWGFGDSLKNAVRVSYGPLAMDEKGTKIKSGFKKVRDVLNE